MCAFNVKKEVRSTFFGQKCHMMINTGMEGGVGLILAGICQDHLHCLNPP